MLTLSFMAICLAVVTAGPTESEIEVREKIVYSTVENRELLLDAFVPQAAAAGGAPELSRVELSVGLVPVGSTTDSYIDSPLITLSVPG